MWSQKHLSALFIIGLMVGCPEAHAQQKPEIGQQTTAAFGKLPQAQTISFSALPPVAQSPGSLLINGIPVDPKDFPTVFRMTTGGTCTSTLVGRAALLTAAHCVPDGSFIRFVLGAREIRGFCEHARGYNPPFNKSEDWALCLLEFPVTGIRYETVDVKGVPALGQKVVLSGYGCIKEGGGLDGILRIGVSEIVEGKVGGFPAESSTIYTLSSISGGEAVLCPGDSGGPLFRFIGNSPGDARRLIGVNSRTTYEYGYSLFAATGSSAGRAFFSEWAARYEQAICGVNTEEECR